MYVRAICIALFPFIYPITWDIRILRRYRYHPVYMVLHQMSLDNHALPLYGQFLHHLTKILPQLPIQRLPSIFRYPYNMILALPSGVP